jgi:hypothetical protein
MVGQKGATNLVGTKGVVCRQRKICNWYLIRAEESDLVEGERAMIDGGLSRVVCYRVECSCPTVCGVRNPSRSSDPYYRCHVLDH